MSVRIDEFDYPLESVHKDKARWEVTLNGKIVDDVETLTLVNRPMGIGVLYGSSPAGPYNQARMVNRGGAVIVPTVKVDGIVYFLALSQVRPLVGSEAILEFPRGQALANEASIETAQRELLEETGLKISLKNLEYLGRGNPDTALIHGSNVHCWWLKLPAKFVTMTDGMPTLRSDIGGNAESKLMENIRKASLVREDEFKSPSMMTSWAAGLVFQRLHKRDMRQIAKLSDYKSMYDPRF